METHACKSRAPARVEAGNRRVSARVVLPFPLPNCFNKMEIAQLLKLASLHFDFKRDHQRLLACALAGVDKGLHEDYHHAKLHEARRTAVGGADEVVGHDECRLGAVPARDWVRLPNEADERVPQPPGYACPPTTRACGASRRRWSVLGARRTTAMLVRAGSSSWNRKKMRELSDTGKAM